MINVLKNHSILYVEDEPEIQANIAEYLESYFDTVYVASDGKSALIQYKTYHPTVLLLDINLPYLSGLEVAQEIRKTNSNIKIIMLTAHTEKEKLLLATELKLTKYLVKPIAPKIFKETMNLLASELQKESNNFMHITPTTFWDIEHEILYAYDQSVALTDKEHRLLKLLIAHKGETVSYADIMIAVWEDVFDKEISLSSVKNQVSQLRKKLPRDAITTIYGKGYLLK